MPSSSSSTTTTTKPPSPTKRSLGEKIISFIVDGPPGTASAKNERDLRRKWDEDRLDLPRTAEEERARSQRMQKRAERAGGGDGLRTNEMRKEGWGGAALGVGHA